MKVEIWVRARINEEDPADETRHSSPRSEDGQLLREGAWSARPRAQEDRCVRPRSSPLPILTQTHHIYSPLKQKKKALRELWEGSFGSDPKVPAPKAFKNADKVEIRVGKTYSNDAGDTEVDASFEGNGL